MCERRFAVVTLAVVESPGRKSFGGSCNVTTTLKSFASSLALVWIPLPYLLGHAESLSGPRLPLDGILLTYTALTLACLFVPAWHRVIGDSESGEGSLEKSR